MRHAITTAGLVVMALAALCGALPGIAHADPPEDAARQLVGYVPKAERYQCTIADPAAAQPAISAEAASISAELSCGPEGAARVIFYLQFTNADAMNRAYATLSSGVAGKPVRSEEGKCPSDGTWGFHKGDDGRVACDYSTLSNTNQPIAETAYRVWTDNRANILGFASPKIGNVDAVALRKWWNANAGPLESADTVTGLASPSSAPNARAARTLLQHVPKTMRAGCKTIDRAPSNATFYGDRLWVDAGVSCTPTQPGATNVDYLAVSPAAIDGYFGDYKPTSDTLSGNCPAVGTYSSGKGTHQRTLGEYSCFFGTGTTGAKPAELAWSDRAHGIVAVAENANGDAAALTKWWHGTEAGPV